MIRPSLYAVFGTLALLGAAYWGLSHLVAITYQYSTQIGDEVVVRFPSWISEETARRSFEMQPRTEGEFVWLEDFHELHFIPVFGFDPSLSYQARVRVIPPFLAAPLPATNVKSFRASTTSGGEKQTVYEPVYATGKYIDINLDTLMLTLFENGTAVNSFPVGAKGNPWKTPTIQGNFQVRSKELKHWSTIYHLWMPYSINFSGDYFIHAWPSWPNGQRVNSVYSGGCIRMHDGDIEKVYNWADVNMPVVVHSTPDVRAVIIPKGIEDGDLVREASDHRVYVVKESSRFHFKRHVPSEKMAEWYPHLVPFWRRIKVVEDGTLQEFKLSRWIRLPQPQDGFEPWDVYEIDDQNMKHLLRCKDVSDCSKVWKNYGWETDEIYTVNDLELMFYPPGAVKELGMNAQEIPNTSTSSSPL